MGCWGSSHGRTCNHRSCWWLAGNCRRSGRRSHNVRTLARLGHNLPWSLRSDRRLCGRARRSGHVRKRRRLLCRGCDHMSSGRRNHYRRTSRNRRRCLRCCFCLLALENSLEGIARLRHLRQVKLRLCVGCRSGRARAARSASQIGADLLRLVDLDRAGVRLLLGDANRRQRVQNGLALYFQFACQIVDSNFAHPSLFGSLAPLAAHIASSR